MLSQMDNVYNRIVTELQIIVFEKRIHFSSSQTLQFFNLIFLKKCFAYTDICTACVSGAYGGQKMMSDPLELALQIVVSHNVAAGDLNLDPSVRVPSALNHRAISTTQHCGFEMSLACTGTKQMLKQSFICWCCLLFN